MHAPSIAGASNLSPVPIACCTLVEFQALQQRLSTNNGSGLDVCRCPQMVEAGFYGNHDENHPEGLAPGELCVVPRKSADSPLAPGSMSSNTKKSQQTGHAMPSMVHSSHILIGLRQCGGSQSHAGLIKHYTKMIWCLSGCNCCLNLLAALQPPAGACRTCLLS